MADTRFSDLPTLNIAFARRGSKTVMVTMQFELPGSSTEVPAESSTVRLNFTRLREAALDPDAYGQRLWEIFFSSTALQKYLAQLWFE